MFYINRVKLSQKQPSLSVHDISLSSEAQATATVNSTLYTDLHIPITFHIATMMHQLTGLHIPSEVPRCTHCKISHYHSSLFAHSEWDRPATLTPLSIYQPTDLRSRCQAKLQKSRQTETRRRTGLCRQRQGIDALECQYQLKGSRQSRRGRAPAHASALTQPGLLH